MFNLPVPLSFITTADNFLIEEGSNMPLHSQEVIEQELFKIDFGILNQWGFSDIGAPIFESIDGVLFSLLILTTGQYMIRSY